MDDFFLLFERKNIYPFVCAVVVCYLCDLCEYIYYLFRIHIVSDVHLPHAHTICDRAILLYSKNWQILPLHTNLSQLITNTLPLSLVFFLLISFSSLAFGFISNLFFISLLLQSSQFSGSFFLYYFYILFIFFYSNKYSFNGFSIFLSLTHTLCSSCWCSWSLPISPHFLWKPIVLSIIPPSPLFYLFSHRFQSFEPPALLLSCQSQLTSLPFSTKVKPPSLSLLNLPLLLTYIFLFSLLIFIFLNCYNP